MSSAFKVTLCLTVSLCISAMLTAMVPPHPLNKHVPSGYQPVRIEMPGANPGGGLAPAKTVPNNILVLRVQFSDVQFQNEALYPDNLIHDEAFFNRWMIHLRDFFSDASHNSYHLNYTLHPQVFTLPQTMGYYGGDTSDSLDANLKLFTQQLVMRADQEIDFSQYGGVIVFHAGAGQESDLSGIRSEEIWSTFLTRKRLQSWFDPENDSYPGYPTADGVNLTNIVIVPESEYQDYFPDSENDPDGAYLFSIYGVLAHQFGHLIGLPTLFDNDSSNGASQGIGNWGLMGTGVWNASGYVPAQLDPWCRMYLGWEQAFVVNSSATDLWVDHFLDHQLFRTRLYKIPVSDTEYFLVENRQQNPDESVNPYNNMPSYTFKLLPEGEQDYYENYPLLPYFNFMENSYAGSEWDFMLPGLGGPIPLGMTAPVDGSGLLVWHIDENVIAEKFTANFDQNTPNADALHKGVDLEEADGIQNLDTAAIDQYKYGSPYDAFRQGNNDYFGYASHNGVLSLPTAESYYGGIPLEIYDISPSGKQMSFSVRFGWSLSTGYEGENHLNACAVDFDQDGENELVYPMPDGQIHIWKDELPLSGFPLSRQPMEHTYVWTGDEFYFPMQLENIARLYRLDHNGGEYLFSFPDMTWATHPVFDEGSLHMALNDANSQHSWYYRYDEGETGVHSIMQFEYPVLGNMSLFRNKLYIPSRQEGQLCVWVQDLSSMMDCRELAVPLDSTLVGVFMAPLLPQTPASEGELIVQCANSIYVFDAQNNILPGFPYVHDMHTTAPLTIADWDTNGSLDLIISSDRGIAVIDYSGSRMSPASLNLSGSDSLSFSSGVLAQDIDNDGRKELLGSFDYNRLNCWEESFRGKAGFPVSFAHRSRNLPVISPASDGVTYAWVAADNGSIFRHPLPDIELSDIDQNWFCEYGNLMRHASRDDTNLPNPYQTSKLFVDGEVYIFPNPLKSIYDSQLTLNVMTSRDTPIEVKIFDINGSLIYSQKGQTRAYLHNRDLIQIPAGKLRSGVYIAVVSGDTESRRLKFAVEK